MNIQEVSITVNVLCMALIWLAYHRQRRRIMQTKKCDIAIIIAQNALQDWNDASMQRQKLIVDMEADVKKWDEVTAEVHAKKLMSDIAISLMHKEYHKLHK